MIFVVLNLCQCTKSLQVMPQHKISAQSYLRQARSLQGQQKTQAYLNAAASLIADHDYKHARKILQNPAVKNTPQKQLLLAELVQHKPSKALRILSKIAHKDSLSYRSQKKYHLLLAQAYMQKNQLQNAINERIKLDRILDSVTEKTANNKQIWMLCNKLSLNELSTQIVELEPGTLKGWYSLAQIFKKNSHSPDLSRQIALWQEQNVNHPASSFLKLRTINIPAKIAVFLPLHGAYARPGNAIKDGISFEQKKYNSQIKFYDTAGEFSIGELYQKALIDQAQIVIGPLQKQNINILAAIKHPIPIIALNDAPNSYSFYSFGLSYTDQAAQIARLAKYPRALLIIPNWGQKIAAAFIKNWSGRITETITYNSKKDLQLKLKDFLEIKQSIARQKIIKKSLVAKVVSHIRPRNDFDMIFLVAYPASARQLKPFLNYFYLGQKPLYAVSAVYGGAVNQQLDRDLNGLAFLDFPYLLSNNDSQPTWPEQLNSYNRLKILGRDSYKLALELDALKIFATLGIPGYSGWLTLSTSNQIKRQLQLAKFNNGKAKI